MLGDYFAIQTAVFGYCMRAAAFVVENGPQIHMAGNSLEIGFIPHSAHRCEW